MARFPTPADLGKVYYSRYLKQPPDFSNVTVKTDFPDGGCDFWVAGLPTLKWEWECNNMTEAQAKLLDDHYAANGEHLGFEFTEPRSAPWYRRVADPLVAPGLAAIAAGALGAGNYMLAYAFKDQFGATLISPTTIVAVSGTEKIQVSAITLPGTPVTVDWYLKFSVGTPLAADLRFLVNKPSGAAFVVSDATTTDQQKPAANTTGVGETFANVHHESYEKSNKRVERAQTRKGVLVRRPV